MSTVQLFSGGFDSILQEAFIKADTLLYVNMGSPYTKLEISHLKTLPKTIQKRLVVTPEYPLAKNYSDKNEYVPFRNLFLLTIAFQYGQCVYFGFNASDNAPDKDKNFLYQTEKLFTHFLKDNCTPKTWDDSAVKVLAPFSKQTKTEMVKKYIETFPSKVSFVQNIRSCYASDSIIGCGDCSPCTAKAVALINNDIYSDDLFDKPVKKKDITYFLNVNKKLRPNNPVIKDYVLAHEKLRK